MKTFVSYLTEQESKITWEKIQYGTMRRGGKDHPQYKYVSADKRFEVCRGAHPDGRRKSNKTGDWYITWNTYDRLSLSNGSSHVAYSKSAADAKKKALMMLHQSPASGFQYPINKDLLT